MSKVYIVSRSDYTDHEILSVWDSLDKANEAYALMKPTYGECVVEEVTLNSVPNDNIPAVYATYTITNEEFTFDPEKVSFQDAITHKHEVNKGHLFGNIVKVFGSDKEHCLDLIQNLMIEQIYRVERVERLRLEREREEAPMSDEEFAAQRAEWLATQRFH